MICRFIYCVRYKKTFRITKKVWAHDESSDARLGDIVRIQPLGYRIGPWKTYVLNKILFREPRDEVYDEQAKELEDMAKEALTKHEASIQSSTSTRSGLAASSSYDV